MSRFPREARLTIKNGLAWCLAAFRFFEDACYSRDGDQLQAAGCIGYGMHNVPRMIQRIQEGGSLTVCVYGPMIGRENDPVKALVWQFFAQDVPGVTLPEGRVLPDSLVEAMYNTMQAFRLGFRPGRVFADEEYREERRQTCLQIAVAMQAHLQRWLTGEEFAPEAFQQDGGWL